MSTGHPQPGLSRQDEPQHPVPRVLIGDLELDRVREASVVDYVMSRLADGQGGWIVTPNVDFCRRARQDGTLRDLVASAPVSVPDGMPLLWAAALAGTPLPERVTGASLIFTLCAAAAAHGRSVYFLGGRSGVPEQAAFRLTQKYPELRVAGTDAPPLGFDATEDGFSVARDKLLAAAPDLVFVGLGFPRQERLIVRLAPELPDAWFVACGAAIPFAAGAVQRAPAWMQRSGLEWAFRLISEPRRLSRRYLVEDLPYAASLLAGALAGRLRPGGRRASRDSRDRGSSAGQR